MQEKLKDAPGSEYKWVGTRAVRPDGVDKVTGRARFGADWPCRASWSARSCAAPIRTPASGRSTYRRPRSCPA